ncbi:hypothetical protein M758_UG005600 [Ceratodon purpureus]|nr:hypothetical protein M758_UG005600 [Ceratodon purpureus]
MRHSHVVEAKRKTNLSPKQQTRCNSHSAMATLNMLSIASAAPLHRHSPQRHRLRTASKLLAAIVVSNAIMTPLQTEVPPNKLLDLVRKVGLISFHVLCVLLYEANRDVECGLYLVVKVLLEL